MRHKIIHCDSGKTWPIQDNCIDVGITSPPYWTLKHYEGNQNDSQVGFYDNYTQYHNKLNKVWAEYMRVLKPGRQLCIVATDLKEVNNTVAFRHIPINAHIIHCCHETGFIYEGTIIWRKTARRGTIPEMYHPVKIRHNCEFIHIFRTPGKDNRTIFLGKNPNNVMKKLTDGFIWTPNPRQKKHPATYPVEIPLTLLRRYGIYCGTVLDAFNGTGTTQVAAEKVMMSSIGLDNSYTYNRIAYKRLSKLKNAVVDYSNRPDQIDCHRGFVLHLKNVPQPLTKPKII